MSKTKKLTDEERRARQREYNRRYYAKKAAEAEAAELELEDELLEEETAEKTRTTEEELNLAKNKLAEMERLIHSYAEMHRNSQNAMQEIAGNVNATLTFLKEQARMNYTSVLMAIENFQNKGEK